MEAALKTEQCEHEYHIFSQRIKETFENRDKESPLFKTNTEDLFDIFLDNLPSERQHYTCHACRRFVNKYGGLVTISEKGTITPVIWEPKNTPSFFKNSVEKLHLEVKNSKVTGVFYSNDNVLGVPTTGEWNHMSVVTCPTYGHSLKSPFQGEAEKKEDFKNIIRAIQEFPLTAVNQAVSLLKNDNLYRSEKLLGAAEWLRDLHESVNTFRRRKTNIFWRFVAMAPNGFCHPRSSMIGTLLEDICEGLSFDVIERRFKEKMSPLQYQRPQALPSSGNIEQAEKIIEKLGIKKSLERRYANLDEIQAIWTPEEKKEGTEKTGGVFSHLKTKDKTAIDPIDGPAKTMTWEKFLNTILPEAEKIEYKVPYGYNSYAAFVTAEHPDSPPILQWDSEEKRNSVSWYLYSNGSYPATWNLSDSKYFEVNAISMQPSMWNGDFDHQGKGVMFILDGAKDNGGLQGNSLFPETLKSELRSVRATIESYSRGATLGNSENASVCGLMLQSSGTWGTNIFRVTSKGIQSKFKLDRWD